ncbi:hypothetical protein PILCRDRAFT_1146 [Piloderma croceum F 1598]|uniref:Uncharacterized protein n=1 Tax=Piloderma croceum (strain F 1598) TaxID=765440 RepID=A0A0C3GJT3_PILCF|nr:hypothetical protein PILCRDRAFT_1146 [Piloderma croceum F 1598]
MTFHTRNAYYLRISSTNVLPLYLYLDERHLDWMSDRVLQYVLADLRPLIVPKLQAETNAHLGPGGPANAKKGSVDVKRGDFYQFAYFLRKTEPHSVLIKSQIEIIHQTRTFGAAPRQIKQAVPTPKPRSSRTQNGKRKSITAVESPGKGRKKRKTKGKDRAKMDDSDDEFATSSGYDSDLVTPYSPHLKGEALRRSNRTKKSVTGGYSQDTENDADYVDSDAFEDVEMITQDPSVDPWTIVGPSVDGIISAHNQTRKPSASFVQEELQRDNFAALSKTANPMQEKAMVEAEPSEIELIIEEEETKPKPLLQLTYQGFNIFENCLCVVVEPWPPIQAVPRAPSISPMFSNAARAPDIAPPDFIPSGQVKYIERERTPLFLPDPERGTSETPAPFQGRMLPPVPLFNDPADREKDDIGGESLMEFSQALNYAGEQRGGLEDDDEMDGAVFFGDADETREF